MATTVDEIMTRRVSCNDQNACRIDGAIDWNSLYMYDDRCRQNGWRKIEQTGVRSTIGEIWISKCDDGNKESDRYIMKIVNYGQATHQGITSEEELLKEVTFQHRASQQGLAPPIYQVLMKEQRGMIIMRIAGEATVLEVIEEILADDEIPVDEKRDRINRYLMGAIDLVRRLHENGILHGDPHLNNIMLDRDGRMSIIDFGLSRNRKDGENPNTDFDQLILQLDYIALNYHGDRTIVDMFRNVSRNLRADIPNDAIPKQNKMIDTEELIIDFRRVREELNELMEDGEWSSKTYQEFIDMRPDVESSESEKLIIAYNNLNTKIEQYRKDHNYNFRAKRRSVKKSATKTKKSAKRTVKKSATKTKKSTKRSVKKSATKKSSTKTKKSATTKKSAKRSMKKSI